MLVLGIRAAFQFMWAWSSALGGFARMLPLPNVAVVLNAIVLVFLLAEMAMVVLGKGRSIHDRILDTRVVLDTKLDEV